MIIGAVAFTAVGVSADNGNLTDEERATKRVEMQERKEAALQEKVSEGVITQDQADQIQAWAEEQMTEREASRDDRLSKEDRQALSDEEREALRTEREAEREAHRVEAEAFFESIGVNKDDLFTGERGFNKRGHKGSRGHSDKGSSEVSVDATSAVRTQ